MEIGKSVYSSLISSIIENICEPLRESRVSWVNKAISTHSVKILVSDTIWSLLIHWIKWK